MEYFFNEKNRFCYEILSLQAYKQKENPTKKLGAKGTTKPIFEARTFWCGNVFTIFIHYVELYRISLARILELEEQQAAKGRGRENRRRR